MADFIYPPSFFDTSVPTTLRVAAKIGGEGFVANLFGNLTHRTWTFGGDDYQKFGTAGVQPAVVNLSIFSNAFPVFNGVLYSFRTPAGSVYAFGWRELWGTARPTHKVDPALPTTAFGTIGIYKAPQLFIDSTRLPSTHTTLSYAFGYSPFVQPDTFIATRFGTHTAANAVTDVTPVSTEAHGSAIVHQNKPATLRIRDYKYVNPPVRYNGIPFQWGFPKKDIFAIGFDAATVSSGIRFPKVVSPTGFDASSFDWWYYPALTGGSRSVRVAYSEFTTGKFGTPTMQQTSVPSIRPTGIYGTVITGMSVYRMRLGFEPTGVRHTTYGTPTVYLKHKTIFPQPIGWPQGVGHYVLRVERQYIGPTYLPAPTPPAVQCVLNDPDLYYMQSEADSSVFGIPEVSNIATIRPPSLGTVWGTAEVTHYTRSVAIWNPLNNFRVGNAKLIRCIHPTGVHRSAEFGDVHRVEENLIRLRPWGDTAYGPVSVQYQIYAIGEQTTLTGVPTVMPPVYAGGLLSGELGQTTVVFGSSLPCCGMISRAVVPKEFPHTQFGDFDARV